MNKFTSQSVIFDDFNNVNIISNSYQFNIAPKKSKLGIMIVGLNGNNGTTFLSSILAHQHRLSFETKDGLFPINLFGSISQYGSLTLGYDSRGNPISKLYKNLIDIANIDDLIISGWDISNDDLFSATCQNKVIDVNLRQQLKPFLSLLKPLPSVFYPSFIAKNQHSKALNILKNKNKWADVISIITDINIFKSKNNLEDVIVFWSASTERFAENSWSTLDELLAAVDNNHPEISPSTIFALASCYTKSIFINGSPQNTISPPLIQLAQKYGAFLAGDDLKTGQTKLKSVLVDYLVSSGIKPLSIVSYNHLGNNDGKNLDEYPQFRSKEITKKNVIDDVVLSNPAIFNNTHPDHSVVIKYIPAVGDSKRAIDEYFSEIALNGKQNIIIHNTCEDSLLAAPLMLDIILFANFFSRITVSSNDSPFKPLPPVLSFLSFFFKAPILNPSEPSINSFFPQKYALENFIRILNGFPPENHINFTSRFT